MKGYCILSVPEYCLRTFYVLSLECDTMPKHANCAQLTVRKQDTAKLFGQLSFQKVYCSLHWSFKKIDSQRGTTLLTCLLSCLYSYYYHIKIYHCIYWTTVSDKCLFDISRIFSLFNTFFHA